MLIIELPDPNSGMPKSIPMRGRAEVVCRRCGSSAAQRTVTAPWQLGVHYGSPGPVSTRPGPNASVEVAQAPFGIGLGFLHPAQHAGEHRAEGSTLLAGEVLEKVRL
jgi:hypothetical protein